jgi:hypothetical protein
MSNLSERVAVRNTAEKFFCESLYPAVTALFLDLAQRYAKNEKVFLTGGAFTKATKTRVDETLQSVRDVMPKNMRFWISPEVFGHGSFSQICLKFKGGYTRPSRRGESVDYVSLYVPTMYLKSEDIARYSDIKPPVYVELVESDIEAARKELATVEEKIRALEEIKSAKKHILSEVGEA